MTILSTIRSLAANAMNTSGLTISSKFFNGQFEIENGVVTPFSVTRTLVLDPMGATRPLAAMRHDRNHVVIWTSQVVQEGDYVYAVKRVGNMTTSFFGKFIGGEVYPTTDDVSNQLAVGLDPALCDWLQADETHPVFLHLAEGFDKLHRFNIHGERTMTRKDRMIADLNAIGRDLVKRNGINACNACIKQVYRIRDYLDGSDIKSESVSEGRSGRITKSDIDQHTGTRPAPDSWDSV